MPRGDLNAVVRYLRRAAGDPTARELTDAQLLDRYLGCQDHNAFAMLVRRHGPLVRSVCRNVLHHEHDADDAFQATFLVLASKAASIRKATALASWLHGVAFRTAMKTKKARKRHADQQDCEGRTADQAATAASLREVQAIVDEALNCLAEKYRAPFVLCCLEGKSRAEAATELGWKEGTVSSRLAQARKELQKRLTRRGVAQTAAMCAVELSRTAAATAVGPSLRGRTIEAALSFAAGKAVGGELVSAKVAVLAKAVMHGMLATKLKIATALGLAVGLTASAGALTIAPPWSGARPDRVTQPTLVTSVPSPNVGKQPRTDYYGDALPAGALRRMGTAGLRHESTVFFVTFLADGRQALSAGEDGLVRLWDVATGKEVCRVEPDKLIAVSAALSADGKTVAWIDQDATGGGNVHLLEAATGKETHCLPAAGIAYMP